MQHLVNDADLYGNVNAAGTRTEPGRRPCSCIPRRRQRGKTFDECTALARRYWGPFHQCLHKKQFCTCLCVHCRKRRGTRAKEQEQQAKTPRRNTPRAQSPKPCNAHGNAGKALARHPHCFLSPQIQAPAKVQTPGADGFINLDGYVQHAVIACRDLDDEVEFWTKGVGMRVLRSRWDIVSGLSGLPRLPRPESPQRHTYIHGYIHTYIHTHVTHTNK